MAILDNLDLVVTVDTSIGHVTGAMGRPVWIMLAARPQRQPVYPTVRLFRQAAPGSWDAVAAAIAAELERG